MKTGIMIGVLVVIGIVYFLSRNNSEENQNIKVLKQIKLEELESVMNQLLNGKLAYDFFGITFYSPRTNTSTCIINSPTSYLFKIPINQLIVKPKNQLKIKQADNKNALRQ